MRKRGQKNSQTEKKSRQREPFNTAQVRGYVRLRRGINRLKKSFPKNSVVNHRAVNKPTEARRPVDLAPPFRGASRAKENQMFEAQQRFRFAVTILLFQESAKSKTSVVPHDCSWTECDDPASLLDSPAKIDVIPGLVIFGIEAACAFKCPPVKSHVTSGNVLGDCVSKQNMTWSARCRGNARLDPILCRRRDVRSADSGIIAADKRADQVVQPIDVCHAVRIGVGEHFTFRSRGAGVAGVTQPMVALVNVSHPWELRRNVALCRRSNRHRPE